MFSPSMHMTLLFKPRVAVVVVLLRIGAVRGMILHARRRVGKSPVVKPGSSVSIFGMFNASSG